MLILQLITITGDPLVDATRIWLKYTRHAVETSVYWWRLEDITNNDIDAVMTISGLDSKKITPTEEIGIINARPRVSFDLSPSEELDEAFKFAKSIGYKL
jgi:hypothetical protein